MHIHEALAHFCWNVRYLRQKFDCTASEMALIMGIGIDEFLQIESGYIPASVNASHIRHLAEYFSISSDSLFGPME